MQVKAELKSLEVDGVDILPAKKPRKPRAKKPKEKKPDPKVLAGIDAAAYRSRRDISPSRSSTLRKLRKAARIAAMVRPLVYRRKKNVVEIETLGAHGWK